jgi:hypothetical protein
MSVWSYSLSCGCLLLVAWLSLLGVAVYMTKAGEASELNKLAAVVRAFWRGQ